MRVLVVEDHEDLAANIGDFLASHGHTVDFALDGLVGLHLALTDEHDVIVLDLTLPRLDGLALCDRLRRQGERQTPVLMLTARDTLEDKLEGFESGADDYLIKPFELRELEARLAALLRRGRKRRRVLMVDDLELDLGTWMARRGERRLKLSRIRLELLKRLMEAAPDVVPSAELEHALWGEDPPESNALSAHVYALRREIHGEGERLLLETVHGLGYRLDGEVERP
jgi:DNA-binding response OmpR family regulator